MKAIVISGFGGPEKLVYKSIPKPMPTSGEVLLQVKAFGLNHAKMYMRKGGWDEYNPITGLECVGLVEDCPGGELEKGSKIIAVMSGMGRSHPGSYGEFVTCPVSKVVPVETSLSWEDLATITEVYSTASACVFRVLDVQKSERFLIRGATSTIGQAALKLAVNAGAIVSATTRSKGRFEWLCSMGAQQVEIEDKNLPNRLRVKSVQPFDKVLNLIGNSVLVQSISLTRPGGRMLQAGWLGGLAPVVDFNPMVEMESGVHFSLFHSKVLGTDAFPLSVLRLPEIISKIEKGEWDAKPVNVWNYDQIHDAHRLLDSHKAAGKTVVKH